MTNKPESRTNPPHPPITQLPITQRNDYTVTISVDILANSLLLEPVAFDPHCTGTVAIRDRRTQFVLAVVTPRDLAHVLRPIPEWEPRT